MSEGAAKLASAPGAALPTAPFPKTASLWVGELADSVGESHLYHIFSNVAPVASIRVCRDQVTRRSLGYAYVNFTSVEHAAAAMKALNYEEVNGKRCRIMWSQRDPSKRKSGSGNIFIKNLAPEVDTRALFDTFSMFGSILSCKIATDPITGASKCYGFVQFETEDSAELAIQKVNGMSILDRPVTVERYRRRQERKSNETWTNCYVKNIPKSWNTDKLKELFSLHGEVTSLVIMTNPATSESRGFGFVNMSSMEEAQAAVEALNGFSPPPEEDEAAAEAELTEEELKLRHDARKLYVARAQKKSERRRLLALKYKQEAQPGRVQGTNLFVKNLADEVNDDMLAEKFAAFGTITSHKVMTTPEGVSRGFGFVCFSTAEEATRAINEANKNIWLGRPLYVALAQRKEVRERQLQEDLEARMQAGSMHRLAMPVGPYGVPMMPGQMPGGGMMPGMYPFAQPGGMMPNMGVPGGYGTVPAARGRGGGRHPPPDARGAGYAGEPAAPGGYARPDTSVPAPKPAFPPPAAAPAPPAPVSSWTEALAGATPEQRKNILGDQLYPLIHARDAQRAGKITGMILEMDASELINLIETPAQLDAKVAEAQQVLEAHTTA